MQPEDLPLKLEATRLERGLTQKAAAAELRISQPHYSKVERGETRPSDGLAERIGDWLAAAGTTRRSAVERRSLELTRLIERHTRELARLVRSGSV